MKRLPFSHRGQTEQRVGFWVFPDHGAQAVNGLHQPSSSQMLVLPDKDPLTDLIMLLSVELRGP